APAWRSTSSAASKVCRRLGLRQSKAPAAIRFSRVRLLSAPGSQRPAKSDRLLYGPPPWRASAVAPAAPRPPLRTAPRPSPGAPPPAMPPPRDAVAPGERAPGPRSAPASLDPTSLDSKRRLGAVDVGRQQADTQPVELLAEGAELVGVADIERHRGGEELDRI